jgi:hypothetical protein
MPLVAATLAPARAGASTKAVPESTHTKCTTKWVKKKVHGKTQRVKVRVCVAAKPKASATMTPTRTPTPTPTATPTETPVPPTVSVSLSTAPSGFTFSSTNGVVTLTDTAYGAQMTLSQFALFKNNDGTYSLYMYVKAAKIPSQADDTSPSWDVPDAELFGLVASNQHPYLFYDGCDVSPEFDPTQLYDGESTGAGWVCSDEIEPQYLAGQYILSWNDGEGYNFGGVPIASVTIAALGP